MKRTAAVTEMPLRRDAPYASGFADDDEEISGELPRRPRRKGVRVSFRGGLVPRTLWGRIAAGCFLLLLTGGAIAAEMSVRGYLLHDPHFVVTDEGSIQASGDSSLTRAQLLSIFGEDVGSNIFRVPLAQRRAELESLPWVEHATVMRLLPNHLRVSVTERVPVAFVRNGQEIGLVDASGAIFDIPGPGTDAGGKSPAHYSFPVLDGISANDPLSTRAARMKIYTDFLAALDAGGEHVSGRLSEVDVSDPEDVKAILPDGANGGDLLVHFGEEKYLERYHTYQQHLAEWRTQYPKLSTVDLRYERQVVLGMQPGATTAPATGSAAGTQSSAAQPAPSVKKDATKSAKRKSVHRLNSRRLRYTSKKKSSRASARRASQ